MVSGVVLSIAKEADAACTVAAEHLERFVHVLVTERNRSLEVLGAELLAELDDAMLASGLDSRVCRTARVAQILVTVETVVFSGGDQCRSRPLTHVTRHPLRHRDVGDLVDPDQLLEEGILRQIGRRYFEGVAAYWTAGARRREE